jgi:hypothetical protein
LLVGHLHYHEAHLSWALSVFIGSACLVGFFAALRQLFGFFANREYRRMGKVTSQLAGRLRERLSARTPSASAESIPGTGGVR